MLFSQVVPENYDPLQGTAEDFKDVRTYDQFTADNDPWLEHDFGAFELEGEKLFWKIDAYDLSMTVGSPNPANDAVTVRVLTIMTAGEY